MLTEPPEDVVRAAVSVSGTAFGVYRARRDESGAVSGLITEWINSAAGRILGMQPREMVGRDLRDFYPRAVETGLWDLMVATVITGGSRTLRIETPGETGTTVMDIAMWAVGEDRVASMGRDITDLAAGERLLAAAYEQTAAVRATMQAALDATTDGFAVYDVTYNPDGGLDRLSLVLMNRAGAGALGFNEPDDLFGQDLREFYPDVEHVGLWDAILAALEAQATMRYRVQQHDRMGIWIGAWDNTIAPVGEDGLVVTWRDVTAEARRERELAQAHDDAHHAATHDPLTGLANRTLLLERMAEALAEITDEERLGVVYADLDRFKVVNDTLGHAAGDVLLQAVAERLDRLVRQGDTVGRMGGDEFVLLLRRLPPEWDSQGFMRRAEAAVSRPVSLADTEVTPQVSYGVVVSPPGPRALEVLLAEADAAMYRVKRARRVPAQGTRSTEQAGR